VTCRLVFDSSQTWCHIIVRPMREQLSAGMMCSEAVVDGSSQIQVSKAVVSVSSDLLNGTGLQCDTVRSTRSPSGLSSSKAGLSSAQQASLGARYIFTLGTD